MESDKLRTPEFNFNCVKKAHFIDINLSEKQIKVLAKKKTNKSIIFNENFIEMNYLYKIENQRSNFIAF